MFALAAIICFVVALAKDGFDWVVLGLMFIAVAMLLGGGFHWPPWKSGNP